MTLRRSRLNTVLIVSFLIALAGLAITAAARKWKHNTEATVAAQQQKDQRITDTLPVVVSAVKGIEIISAFIDAEAEANIVVLNNTGKGVTGLAISSGNLMFSDDNGLTNDKPVVLIRPFSTYTFQQPVSNLRANSAIRVSAVFFDDGTDEGEPNARANVRKARDHEKEKRHQRLGIEKGSPQ